MSLDCYSKVNLLPDNSGWVTSLENDALKDILFGLGVDCISKRITLCQTVYFPDKYSAIKNSSAYRILGNKLAFDYYHGDPFITPEFLPLLKRLKKSKSHFDRIRVSHSGIEDLLSNEGLHDKVFRIPIGIDSNLFSPQTPKSKSEIRSKLGIPQSSFVIGSFQKDGNGWGVHSKTDKRTGCFLKYIKNCKESHVRNICIVNRAISWVCHQWAGKTGCALQTRLPRQLSRYMPILSCFRLLPYYFSRGGWAKGRPRIYG